MTLYLYLVAPTQTSGFDVYSSFICAAETDQAASKIHPDPDVFWYETRWARRDTFGEPLSAWEWRDTPDTVRVQLIGVALPDATPGVVLAQRIS